MSLTAKSRLTDLLTILVLVFTTFQGLIPTLPTQEPMVITVLSAITMFMVSVLTTWKQYISVEISNKAVVPTLILTIIAMMGAANEMSQAFPLSETAGQWTRFAITFLIMILNIISKVMWPTDQTKSSI